MYYYGHPDSLGSTTLALVYPISEPLSRATISRKPSRSRTSMVIPAMDSVANTLPEARNQPSARAQTPLTQPRARP